ncbi:uncharacterized protein [Ptychodera flava]|uniref:uncharacterized protein n=1 Tax=Ptychodera flava TaxID=63121 RepID=UPI003969C25D
MMVNKLKLKTDIQEFKRRCRLQYKFREENSDPDNNLDNNVKQGPFTKEKSHYNPPPNENLTLEAFLSAVEQDIVNEDNWRQTYDNIDPDERLAIKQLRNNNAITIKAADKGNGIVVMDTQDYINKCLEHLNNTNYYQTLDQDPTEIYTKELQTKIRRWLQKNWITNDTAKKLFPKEPSAGHFYGLPKVHKQNIPLRPIIPQCNSITTPMATFVDFHLQPIVRSLPSFIKDTTHHLQDLQHISPPEGAILVTMDVVSLYTNIPHSYGIQAVKEMIEENNTITVNPELICEMLQFILTKNYFEFNGQYYLQICGTAMGSKVAPSYANITMGK